MAKNAHLLCMSRLPPSAVSLPELKALVCAENFSSLAQSQLYISSGLIHLFVVSGAHLLLLENILNRFSVRPLYIFLFLLLYAFACQLNPPVVRSLLSFAVSALLLQKNIRWPSHLKILFCGLATLLLNYRWISSLSLQMSWMAAFLASAVDPKRLGAFFRQSLFFVILFPSVVFFQIPAAVSILLNLILAPVLEFLLFPMALLIWVFPYLAPLFDFVMELFRRLLQALEIEFQLQAADTVSYLVLLNWGLILALHLGFHLYHVKKGRVRCVS